WASPAVASPTETVLLCWRGWRSGRLGHGYRASDRLGRHGSDQSRVGAPGDVATPGLVPQAPAVIGRVPVAVAAEAIAVALVRAAEAAVVKALAIRLAVALA